MISTTAGSWRLGREAMSFCSTRNNLTLVRSRRLLNMAEASVIPLPERTVLSARRFTAAPTPSAGPLQWPASLKFQNTWNPKSNGTFARRCMLPRPLYCVTGPSLMTCRTVSWGYITLSSTSNGFRWPHIAFGPWSIASDRLQKDTARFELDDGPMYATPVCRVI